MRGRRIALAVMLVGGLLMGPAPASSASATRPAGHPRPIRVAGAVLAVRAESIRDAASPTPRVVYGATVTRRLVALTFDLDMSPWMVTLMRTGQVRSWVNQDALDLLQQSGVHATLFMTGMWAELYPDLARKLATSGQFEIANHTYSHAAYHLPCYRLAGLSRSALAADLQASQTALERITGVTPTYFRFPGGCYDPAALDAVHAAGLIPVQWTINATDAFNPYPEQIASIVTTDVRPGAIVMMHLHGGPNAPATAAALRIILPALQKLGYEFVTVSALLEAGSVIEPIDPREVVEATPRPEPTPAPRWCLRWVSNRTVWVRC